MSNTMFDAKEVLIPGSAYDRSNVNGMFREPVVRTHDQLGFIGPDRNYTAGLNLPVPVGMFMPPPMTQPFHPPQPPMPPGRDMRSNRGNRGGMRQKPPRYSNMMPMHPFTDMSGSQASQDASQPYSQGPLTQGHLSMSQPFAVSQGMPGLSQLSQDSYMGDEFIKSQADILLSQDSTYQGDRLFLASQLSQGPFN